MRCNMYIKIYTSNTASIVDLNEYYKVDVSELDGAGLDEAQPEKAEEEEEYPKVRVEAYVEALCPYCKDFVVGPLTDALSKADIAAIVDLKVIFIMPPIFVIANKL